MMLNKTGGLRGQFSYVVMAPQRGVGVFVSINQFSIEGFTGMVEAANKLIADLAPREAARIPGVVVVAENSYLRGS
jgi:D-alanyl-D-alanine-carboxypeptidase/D-alanyl-D-alanine-endopeptidase